MRKACDAIGLSRVVFLYQSKARHNTLLVMLTKDVTQRRVHYGNRRVQAMLRHKSFKDNHKQSYHLSWERGLTLRHMRPERSKYAQLQQPKTLAKHVNQIWTMDFVADNLFDGRKLRMRTVVD